MSSQSNKIYDRKYDSKMRFISYWYQAHEIFTFEPNRVLEIGVGSGFLSLYLKHCNISVKTVDIDRERHPDVVAPVTRLPFENGEFDVVVAYEVLEHLPYEKFGSALCELARVASRAVIISLPTATRFLRFEFPIPFVTRIRKLIETPFLPYRAPLHREHFWEIGIRGYPRSRIADDIRVADLVIQKQYRVFENPRHYFFVLSKISS